MISVIFAFPKAVLLSRLRRFHLTFNGHRVTVVDDDGNDDNQDDDDDNHDDDDGNENYYNDDCVTSSRRVLIWGWTGAWSF